MISLSLAGQCTPLNVSLLGLRTQHRMWTLRYVAHTTPEGMHQETNSNNKNMAWLDLQVTLKVEQKLH